MATEIKPVTPANMRHLAEQLMDYFAEIECWYDMGIYVDNERWASSPRDSSCEQKTTAKGTVYYVEDGIDIASSMEYSNPETVSIFFEGPLYSKINYEDYGFLYELGEKFLTPYGLYFEQGYAWNAAAFPV